MLAASFVSDVVATEIPGCFRCGTAFVSPGFDIIIGVEGQDGAAKPRFSNGRKLI